MTHTTYVVKVGDKYCKFGSYGEIKLVDNPLKASLFSVKGNAEKKSVVPRGYWAYDQTDRLSGTALKVVKISAEITEED